MWIPSIARHFSRDKPAQVLIVGIESHICVTQTALDLLREEHDVYVCVDGVSSCNREEVPVALARLAREGVRCVSSEGWLVSSDSVCFLDVAWLLSTCLECSSWRA